MTGVRLVDARTVDGDFNEVTPKGILARVINQHDIGAVFVFERICHSSGFSVYGWVDWLLCRFSSSSASA